MKIYTQSNRGGIEYMTTTQASVSSLSIDIAANILRAKGGTTKRELSKASGVAKKRVVEILNGRDLSITELVRLAGALGVAAESLCRSFLPSDTRADTL